MEPWRMVWREGFAPLLSVRGLNELRIALVNDDPRLIQGATTSPPPLRSVAEWQCQGACAIALAVWKNGDDAVFVGAVEERFARICFAVDNHLGEPASARHFLNWFDDMPRSEVFRELLPEVDRALAERAQNLRAEPQATITL